MENRIKVFVGTDPFMRKAELALEYSIRKSASEPVDIVWMDYSRGGIWDNWNIGRPKKLPYASEGWSTDFTCFRFAIPGANNYEGRAIYLDADMILLRDINELFTLPMDKPVIHPPARLDVMLFDCKAFKEFEWWPTVDEMKCSQWNLKEYYRLMNEHKIISDSMPALWDCLDGVGYDPLKTGLVHYTEMNTQPWHPYPERFKYPPHPRPDMVQLWQKFYDEALASEK